MIVYEDILKKYVYLGKWDELQCLNAPSFYQGYPIIKN